MFKYLDASTKGKTILASTTSSLSITSIGANTRNPERIAGVHFFNPLETSALYSFATPNNRTVVIFYN